MKITIGKRTLYCIGNDNSHILAVQTSSATKEVLSGCTPFIREPQKFGEDPHRLLGGGGKGKNTIIKKNNPTWGLSTNFSREERQEKT